jgi:hypothetical protein
MPWVFMLIKEVLGCFKPREVAKKRYYSRISEWGNPAVLMTGHFITESYASNHR